MEKLEVEKLIKEHLAHKETGDKTIISGLFYSFKEEMLVALTKIEGKIGELVEHQKIANGRTGKLEGEVHKLREADVLMGEQLKNLRNDGEKTSGRIWQVIIGVVIAVILSALGYIIKII
mgnify:FL=1